MINGCNGDESSDNEGPDYDEYTVDGYITDSVDYHVQGAQVTIEDPVEGSGADFSNLQATSDASGYYYISNVPDSPWGLRLNISYSNCTDYSDDYNLNGSDKTIDVQLDHCYEYNGDGTISNLQTGLMWENSMETIWRGKYNWWQAAGEYHETYNSNNTDVCGNLTLSDYTDWRLPTFQELVDLKPLLSIFDNWVVPDPNDSYFENYWSSTHSVDPPHDFPEEDDPDSWPYNIGFSGFGCGPYSMGKGHYPSNEYQVRCVRFGITN